MSDLLYTTRDGDVLDAICLERYGATAAVTERVLGHNLGLADQGPVLPAGVRIILPDYPPQDVRPSVVRLWD